MKKKHLKKFSWFRALKMKNKYAPFWKFWKEKNIDLINNGGWHFTYLMSCEKIAEKIKSSEHSEFNNETLNGFIGDTLASALIANNKTIVGRSFKYHRPRGIFSAGPEEPNALVHLREGAFQEPNTKATVIELFDGLNAFLPQAILVSPPP